MGKKAARKAAPKPAAKPAPAKQLTPEQEETQDQERVRAHFSHFDLNGDGFISHEELTMVLSSMDSKQWTDATIGQLLRVIDKNQDGRILYDEFCDWVFTDAENEKVADRVKSISAEGHKYVVLEVCDNVCAFLRTPDGAIAGAFQYSREVEGYGSALVHGAGRAFCAENAFRTATKIGTTVPVVLLLDAAKPGGNFLPSAAMAYLDRCGFALTDPESAQVKIVVAAPTLSTPRGCLLGSTSLSTRYFLWELQRACVKFKYAGKIGFIPRESLYVGLPTLCNDIIPKVVDSLAECPQRNLGSTMVKDYCEKMSETIKKHSDMMAAAGCKKTFRYFDPFESYINFEPDKENLSWPPGYGANPTGMLAGHTSQLLCDDDDTKFFEIGDGTKAGSRMVDSVAAEASPEKVFVITRRGFAHPTAARVGTLLQAMSQDEGVTLWTEETVISTFGPKPHKEAGKPYEDYLCRCREGMDGVSVLDFPVEYWVNEFLIDLVNAEFVTVVLAMDPGYDYERYGFDDQSGYDVLDFIDLHESLPYASISSVLLLPVESAACTDWAHCGAFLKVMRDVHDGVILMPSTCLDTWGPKFLATWLSITSTPLKHRFTGHLSIGAPHNISLAYYNEGESSSASIDHMHTLQAAGPLCASYTVSCGHQAGFRLEGLLGRLSNFKIMGGAFGEEYLQAAGETSDDHGDRSLEVGAVRYATAATGGKGILKVFERCAKAMETKAETDAGRDADAKEWSDMASGPGGLQSWIADETSKACQAFAVKS